MKKKIFIILSVLICVLCSAFLLTACVEKGTPQYTVTLKANGGAFTDGRTTYVITVDSGSSIQGLVPYPSLEGYVFEGWAEDEAGINIKDIEGSAVTANIVVHAVWAEKVTVTFNANGGQFDSGDSVILSDVKKGGNATALTEISRENYEFGGWYKGEERDGKIVLSESFDFTQNITEDISVYAKWNLQGGVALSAPTNIVVSGDSIAWDEVDGADSYHVIITNREDEDNEIFNYKSFGTTVAYDFYRWSYGEGSYTVYVRSNGDGINYTNSAYASKRYDFGLKSVNISFNSSSSELTWEEGSDLYPCAEDYDLYIYDAEDYTALSEPIISIEATTATGFDMSSFQAGAYYVRIVSNRSRFTSVTATYSLFKTRLAAPDAVIAAADEEFSSIQLQWNEVKNATSYIITIGSNNYITSALSFTWQKDTYYFESSSQFDFTSDTNLIAVRAFDDNHDYFVSAPTELAAGRDALVDISVSGEQGGVTVSGELYEYNEAPFTVTIDYLSNLYAYDTAKTLKNYFKLYYSKNGTLYSSLEDNYAPSKMLRTQSITEESGLELPEYFRLCFVPHTLYNIKYTYIQCGWYADLECTVPFDFSAPVTRDITIYAGWIEINEKIKVDDIFNNDFSQSSYYSTTGSYSANTESDVNVYFAARVSMKYTIDYNNDISGSQYANCISVYNMTKGENIATINVIYDSVRSYEFEAEAGDIIRLTFSHTGDVASTLNWKCYRGTLSTMPSGGKAGENNYCSVSSSSSGEVCALKGTIVTLSAEEKDGYSFLGWYDSNDSLVSREYNYSFTADSNARYSAKWEEIQ